MWCFRRKQSIQNTVLTLRYDIKGAQLHGYLKKGCKDGGFNDWQNNFRMAVAVLRRAFTLPPALTLSICRCSSYECLLSEAGRWHKNYSLALPPLPKKLKQLRITNNADRKGWTSKCAVPDSGKERLVVWKEELVWGRFFFNLLLIYSFLHRLVAPSLAFRFVFSLPSQRQGIHSSCFCQTGSHQQFCAFSGNGNRSATTDFPCFEGSRAFLCVQKLVYCFVKVVVSVKKSHGKYLI